MSLLPCLSCFSFSLLVLTIIGRTWEDIGQILFTAIVIGMVTLIGTLGVYAGVNKPEVQPAQLPDKPASQLSPSGRATWSGWPITTTSGESEIALASPKQIGAKEYIVGGVPIATNKATVR